MISVVNFIPSKFESFPQAIWKVVLHTRLSVYRESSGDSWFVTDNLLVYYKWSKTKIYFIHQFDFPSKFYPSVCPLPFQNNIHCWWIEIKKDLNTNFIIKLGICPKKPFDIITITPRGALGLTFVHIDQLMTHPAVYRLSRSYVTSLLAYCRG